MQETFWSTRTRIETDDEPDPAFVSSTPGDGDGSYTPSDEISVSLSFSNLKAFGD